MKFAEKIGFGPEPLDAKTMLHGYKIDEKGANPVNS
jgi:hypothetical protein